MNSVVEFGDALLRTRDLDPVYVAVEEAKLDERTKARLCLAYWCFYALGASARIAEARSDKQYWQLMLEAAHNVNKEWPRGTERRHFRGRQSISAVEGLIAKYRTAEHAVEDWCSGGSFQAVSKAVQCNRGFGPWIAFKIADMSERVLGYSTDFADCHLGIYDDPRKGAAIALLEWLRPVETGLMRPEEMPAHPWEYPITDQELEATVNYYVGLWRRKRAKAPPRDDRLVNVQEIETIFCKYKSHLRGRYPIGKDSRETAHSLDGWGDLAQQLAKGIPHVNF